MTIRQLPALLAVQGVPMPPIMSPVCVLLRRFRLRQKRGYDKPCKFSQGYHSDYLKVAVECLDIHSLVIAPVIRSVE